MTGVQTCALPIWKVEATEGDTATAAVIADWYKQVYEPKYTASEPSKV